MNLIPRTFDIFDNMFDDFVPSVSNKMRCDIYEKGGDYHIEMDIPGFNKEDIKIESNDGYLTISAEKSVEDNDEDKNYIRRERSYGRYERTFYVGDYNDEDIEAEFKDGMLRITVPKKEQKSDKKYIDIK